MNEGLLRNEWACWIFRWNSPGSWIPKDPRVILSYWRVMKAKLHWILVGWAFSLGDDSLEKSLYCSVAFQEEVVVVKPK